jgi:hypothetical protein
MREISAGHGDNTCKPTRKRVVHQAMGYLVCSLTLLTLSLLTPRVPTSHPNQNTTDEKLRSEQNAITQQAMMAIGISGRQPFAQSQSCRVAMVEGGDVPVPDSLLRIVAGRKVWRVDFDDVLIREVKSEQGTTVEKHRPITVYLDSLSGRLIMVQSVLVSDRVLGDREMPTAEREQALLSSPKFRGLPDSVTLDFVSALQYCPFSPHLAERIAGVYIYEAKKNAPDSLIPVWVISLVGIPPVPETGVPGMNLSNPVPEHMRNAVQVVIDARTGRPLRSRN